MNNLTKYLISFALLCLSNVAISETIEFSINCKILDQVVLEVVDGESKRYSGLNDVKVGDKTSITFKFESLGDSGYVIDVGNGQFPTVSVRHSLYKSNLKQIYNNDVINWTLIDPAYSTSLGENFINLEGPQDSSIAGKRYFKNDWGFVIKSGFLINNLLQTLNCMSVPADYNRMLKKVRDYHKANPIKPK
tara:strand:- start:81 stop:653 length:573 start_codon:yes stop_codon:yes gene_type:complete